MNLETDKPVIYVVNELIEIENPNPKSNLEKMITYAEKKEIEVIGARQELKNLKPPYVYYNKRHELIRGQVDFLAVSFDKKNKYDPNIACLIGSYCNITKILALVDKKIADDIPSMVKYYIEMSGGIFTSSIQTWKKELGEKVDKLVEQRHR